jgi:RHS repeat-associated protein
VVRTTYPQNDVLTVVSPAPSGENTKQIQEEYDGLGRLTKSCAIGNGSGTACGQNTGSQNGVTTSCSYTYAPGSITVTATLGGVQSRSMTYDAMGRLISTTTPEAGVTSYIYDVASSTCGGHTSWGDLVEKVDNSGMHTCFTYDQFHRLGGLFAWTGTGSILDCRSIVYDYMPSPPSGITELNTLGRIVEALVSFNCNSTADVDEWFSYDKDGRMTDMWEKTPHSGQYYHSVATFYGNGRVNTLQLASPSLFTMTYGIDGEGRWKTVVDTTSGTSLVTGATFYPAADPAVVSLTGSDKDSFTVDTNTGRMTQYAFAVGQSSLTANLNWNPNSTLKQLTIIDGFNAGGTQTCNFNPTLALNTGYDDLGRLVGVDCGSSGWGQTFSYDIFRNLSKAVIAGRTGTTWNPGYSTTTNHYTCTGCSYDPNGNVTNDGNNVYGWNEFSKMKWAATSGTPSCGSSGMCITYDAFGRIVETSNGSTWTERWITQLGETVYMSNGIRPNYSFWPAPAGERVLIGGNGGAFNFLHNDWLGNARITSSLGGHAITHDVAYSPYGERYAEFGTAGSQYTQFAGIKGNFYSGVTWDAPNRELSIVGRWLSPDPAGAGWNQYAYSTNPNSFIDPSGLDPDDPCSDFDPFCGGPPGYCPPEFENCDPGCDPNFGCGGPGVPPPPGQPPIGGAPSPNPPSSNPPSETVPGVDYATPWWQEWGGLPPWLTGALGGQGFPPDCPTDFGAPCSPIDSGFIYNPNYQPWSPGYIAWLNNPMNPLNRFFPDPGPPRLARPRKKVGCVNSPCFSNGDVGVISVAPPDWLTATQGCVTATELAMGGGSGDVHHFQSTPTPLSGSANYTKYPAYYDAEGQAQGAGAGNAAAFLGGVGHCMGGIPY